MSGRLVLKGKRSIKVGPTSPMETVAGSSVALEDCGSALESFPNSSGSIVDKPEDKAPCLAVPKRSKYERRRSPLAGDESPMDGLVVHPETFQAEPAQGFADVESTASGTVEYAQKEVASDSDIMRASSTKRHSPHSLLERKKTRVTPMSRERPVSTTSSSDEVFHGSMLCSTMSQSGVGGRGARLSTAAARKGGRTTSADTEWSFDGLTQLHSIFPDQELTVFVGTWNMAEIKVRTCVYVRMYCTRRKLTVRACVRACACVHECVQVRVGW